MKFHHDTNNNVTKKLRSRVGETIAETLVALLIAALALTMLAGAISAASGIVTKSRAKLNAYYSTNETTVVGMPASGTPSTVSLAGSGNAVKHENIPIEIYVNDTFSNAPVIAYKKSTSQKAETKE